MNPIKVSLVDFVDFPFSESRMRGSKNCEKMS